MNPESEYNISVRRFYNIHIYVNKNSLNFTTDLMKICRNYEGFVPHNIFVYSISIGQIQAAGTDDDKTQNAH